MGRFKIRQNNFELVLNALFSLSLVNVEVKTLWLQCQETIQPYRYLGLHLNIRDLEETSTTYISCTDNASPQPYLCDSYTQALRPLLGTH